MLLIVEGLDRSGKSTITDLLTERFRHLAVPTVLIRKTYDERLYPINYTIAQMYDWQALLDRVILTNPDTLFIADRSFITQTAFQLTFGINEHAQTPEQKAMFDNYCKVCHDAVVIYCKSNRFELDHMIQSMLDRNRLDCNYASIVSKFKHSMMLDMDSKPLAELLDDVVKFLQSSWPTWHLPNT